MKFKNFKKIFFIFMTAFIFIHAGYAHAANTEEVSGGYTVNGTNYKLLKGAFTFPSGVAINKVWKDISARFFYSDGFFAEDPYKYNTHLATASLCMAMAGFYSNEGAVGKDADYSKKWINIYNYMRDIGVAKSDIYRNVYNSIRPQTDSIGVTIGSKALTQNNRTLIIISIRGSNYEREWTSNVTLGGDTTKEAAGFSSAAEIVFGNIKNYIDAKDLTSAVNNGKVDFWISGYSRAGATTNLTARRLVDTYITGLNKNGNQVFAYCNEAPQGGVESTKNSSSDYSCIHNVINKNDLVPYVAPKGMNFLRYGVDHYIPGSAANYKSGNAYDNEFYSVNNANYASALAKMEKQLTMVNSNITFDDNFKTKGLDTKFFSIIKKKFIQDGTFELMNNYLDTLFLNYLTGWTSVNRALYAKNLQAAVRDYMAVLYNATEAQRTLFNSRVKAIIDNDIGVRDVLGLVRYALGKWHKPRYKYKKYYTDKLINLLEDKQCFAALELDEAVKQRLIRVDLPFLLDFVMTFVSVDYDNNLYETRGLTQVLTLALNSANIFLNHEPEVTLAWLRSYDSLYDGESGVVTRDTSGDDDDTDEETGESEDSGSTGGGDIGDTGGSTGGGDIGGSGNSGKIIITDILEVPDTFVKRGTEPYSALPRTVTAGCISGDNGDILSLTVTWDNSSVKWYSHAENVSEDLWTEIPSSQLESKLKEPEALKAVFTGKAAQPSNSELDDGVSLELTGNVYVAGLARLETPDSSLPDGEYYGSQKVKLTHTNGSSAGKIMYSISEIVYNEDGSTSGGGMFPEEYTGTIKIGSDDATEEKHYLLLANVESSNSSVNADSETMIWEYTIKPASSDESSDYVGSTSYQIFTYSRDVAVYWRVKSGDIKVVTSSNSLKTAENEEDTIFIDVEPYDAETVKTKDFEVIVMTVAGTTLKGVYNIPVQYSEDGVTWIDENSIEFDTVDDSDGDDDDDSDDDNKTGSSKGSSKGCHSGISILSFLLFSSLTMLLSALRRK